MNPNSEEITNGIKVLVEPEFIPNAPNQFNKNYLFSYNITITNVGEKWAKLISRKWIIIDSEGKEEVVEGDGVVGHQPELEPGDSFSYTSYCPLNTEWGTMEGHFNMVDKEGKKFIAKVGRFYLISTDVSNITSLG